MWQHVWRYSPNPAASASREWCATRSETSLESREGAPVVFIDNPPTPARLCRAPIWVGMVKSAANRWFADSPLERAGFEPSVPRESGFGFAPEGPNVGIQLFQRRAGRSRFPRPVTSENLPITIIAPAEAQPAPHTSLPSRTMAIGRR